MKWIAWGWRVVDGEREPYIIGELECESLDLTALLLARKRFRYVTVDHVQSALSYESELREKQPKLVFNRHHPRRKRYKKLGPFGETLTDAVALNDIMSSGNNP